jgi:putative flippase GtrA
MLETIIETYSLRDDGRDCGSYRCGVFALLVEANLSILPASVLSFCTAALVNYQLTSKYVFSHNANVRGFLLFLSAALVRLTVNVGVTLVPGIRN